MPNPRAWQGSQGHPMAWRRGWKFALYALSFLDQGKSLINPADDASDHFFYRPTHLSEPDGSLVRPIAVRACAVDDDHSLLDILFHTIFRDREQRNVDRTGNVAFAVALTSANIDENEVNSVGSEGG